MKKIILFAMASACFGTVFASPKEVLESARYFWDFADAERMKSFGNVRAGVRLKGIEREESLARGGDGKVAKFEGGWLEIAAEDGGLLQVGEDAFTVFLRVRDLSGKWESPLLGNFGDETKTAFFLRGVDGRSLPMFEAHRKGDKLPSAENWYFGDHEGPRRVKSHTGFIECFWGADKVDAPRFERIRNEADRNFSLYEEVSKAYMRFGVPVEKIGAEGWRDIAVCFSGARISLWVDGVEVEREFPIGKTRRATVPTLIGAMLRDGKIEGGFDGLVDHVAIWDRALTGAEIAGISGGAELVAKREVEILGELPKTPQYLRPRGWSVKNGDCMPFFHDGEFHLFYAVVRRNRHSKWDWGHGAIETRHVSSRDLKNWTWHPDAIEVTEQWEAWNGTGAPGVDADGVWHFYYPCPSYNAEWPFTGVQYAKSFDGGKTFVKQEPHPFFEGGDVDMFYDGDTGLFNLIKGGKSVLSKLPKMPEHTLVVWAKPDDSRQVRSGVFGVFEGMERLGIVFDRGEWLVGGTEGNVVSKKEFRRDKEETVQAKPVQIAMSVRGREVSLFRDGSLSGIYEIKKPLAVGGKTSALIGALRHDGRNVATGQFRGEIFEARIYDKVLSGAELSKLRRGETGSLCPKAWWNFAEGTKDVCGNLPDGDLLGEAKVTGGSLSLRSDGCFRVPQSRAVLVRLETRDFKTFTEARDPLFTADFNLGARTCPHLFEFRGKFYYFGGNNMWVGDKKFGPFKIVNPRRLEELSVPKTAPWKDGRRLLAGFLIDGRWGGNAVIREMVTDDKGRIGTKFVPEMIPEAGAPVELRWRTVAGKVKFEGGKIILDAEEGQVAAVCAEGVPNDFRLGFSAEPLSAGAVYAVDLRARRDADLDDRTRRCRLNVDAKKENMVLETMRDSALTVMRGVTAAGVADLEKRARFEVICKDDIVDVELNETRTLANRYYDARGDCLLLVAKKGRVVFDGMVLRKLE